MNLFKMAYKIKLWKSAKTSNKNDVYISKEQIKELNKNIKDKKVTGVVVYLNKE